MEGGEVRETGRRTLALCRRVESSFRKKTTSLYSSFASPAMVVARSTQLDARAIAREAPSSFRHLLQPV